jgi:hypothetical protein
LAERTDNTDYNYGNIPHIGRRGEWVLYKIIQYRAGAALIETRVTKTNNY